MHESRRETKDNFTAYIRLKRESVSAFRHSEGIEVGFAIISIYAFGALE